MHKTITLFGVLLALMANAELASALDCYDCMLFDVDWKELNLNDSMRNKLEHGLAEVSDENCRIQTEAQKSQVDVTTCEAPPGGSTPSKCATISGTGTVVLALDKDYTIQVSALGRKCMEVPFINGCVETKASVDQTSGGVSLGDLEAPFLQDYDIKSFDIQLSACFANGDLSNGHATDKLPQLSAAAPAVHTSSVLFLAVLTYSLLF